MRRFVVLLWMLAVAAGDLHAQCGPGGCLPGQWGPGRPPVGGLAPSLTPDNAQVPAELVAASVHVKAARSCGSGTVIYVNPASRTGAVLTCKHVVGNERSFMITFPDGKAVKGSAHKVDHLADLAIIVIDADTSTPWVPLARTHPVKGMAIWQVGYPGGRGPVRRQGEVLGYTASTPTRGFHPSFTIRPGDSGSGIFLSSENALCGVCWGAEPGTDQAVAVEWRDVARFCSFLPQQQPKEINPPAWATPGTPAQPAKPYEPWLPGLPDKRAIADLHKRLDQLDRQVSAIVAGGSRQQGAIDSIHGKLSELEGGLGNFKTDHAGLAGDLGTFRAHLGEIKGRLAGLGKLQQDLAQVQAKLPELAAKLPAIAAAAPEAAAWPAVLTTVGAATGGVGVPLLLGGMLLARAIGRARTAGVGSHSLPTPTDFGARPIPPATMPTPPAAPPRSAAPPPTHEIKFVPVEQQPDELRRLLKAMEVAGRDYPGMASSINLIQGLAKQLQTSAVSSL